MVGSGAQVFLLQCRHEQDEDHLRRVSDDRQFSEQTRRLLLSPRRRSLRATRVLDIHVDECGKCSDINVHQKRSDGTVAPPTNCEQRTFVSITGREP